jgi:hypothetical protein
MIGADVRSITKVDISLFPQTHQESGAQQGITRGSGKSSKTQSVTTDFGESNSQ